MYVCDIWRIHRECFVLVSGLKVIRNTSSLCPLYLHYCANWRMKQVTKQAAWLSQRITVLKVLICWGGNVTIGFCLALIGVYRKNKQKHKSLFILAIYSEESRWKAFLRFYSLLYFDFAVEILPSIWLTLDSINQNSVFNQSIAPLAIRVFVKVVHNVMDTSWLRVLAHRDTRCVH